jgi:predicted secreted protein
MTGNIIVTGYSVTGSFDGLVEASISFQGVGAITYAVNG